MESFEIPGLIIAIVLFSLIVVWQGRRNVPPQFQNLVSLSVVIRILGVIAYALVVFGVYGGGGDPVIYFRWGQRFAEYFRDFNLSPFYNPNIWRGPSFVGTNFVGYPAALLILMVGESFRGTWLLYSIFCLIGLFYFAKVFYRAYGITDYKRYLYILIIYPSLWFWTATISKDTWVLFGVAIFLTGMVTKQRKQSVFYMALGLIWCYLVRPQMAAILAVATAGAYILGTIRSLNFKNILVLVLASVGALYFLSVVGVSDLTDAADYAQQQQGKSSYGGSEIQLFSGPMSYLMGPVNILFRPFPWEIRGALQLISFADIYFIWYLAFRNRAAVKRSILMIRKDRLIAFSFIFIALFSVAAGVVLSNLGLIARQRIILYPFMFLIIYAYSDKRMVLVRRKKAQERAAHFEKIKQLQNA